MDAGAFRPLQRFAGKLQDHTLKCGPAGAIRFRNGRGCAHFVWMILPHLGGKLGGHSSRNSRRPVTVHCQPASRGTRRKRVAGNYDETGVADSTAAGPAEVPDDSPTLSRTNRRMEMFSPSLAIICAIISPTVTDS